MQADPFSILGVGEDADAREIAAAYRRLAMRWHPDRNPGDPRAAVRFRRVRRAYEILRDPRARGFFESARRARADSVFVDTPPAARPRLGWRSPSSSSERWRGRRFPTRSACWDSRSRLRSPAACRRRRKPVCKRAFLRFVAVCRLLFFSLAAAGFCCACWTPIGLVRTSAMVPDADRTMSAAPPIESGALARAFAERGERALLAAFMTAGFPARDDTVDALERSPPGRTSSKSARRFGSGRGRNGDSTRIGARARQRHDFAVGVVANPRLSRPPPHSDCRDGLRQQFPRPLPRGERSIRFEHSRRRFGGGGRERNYRRRFGGFRRRSWRPILRAAESIWSLLSRRPRPAARVRAIAAKAEGFLYFVSLKGVTGAGHLNIESVAPQIARVRQIAAMPVAAGFGVRAPSQARELAAQADGVGRRQPFYRSRRRSAAGGRRLAARARRRRCRFRAALGR